MYNVGVHIHAIFINLECILPAIGYDDSNEMCSDGMLGRGGGSAGPLFTPRTCARVKELQA